MGGDDFSYTQRTKHEPHSLSIADPGSIVTLKNRYPVKMVSADISCTEQDANNVRFKDESTISYFESSLGNEQDFHGLKKRYGNGNGNGSGNGSGNEDDTSKYDVQYDDEEHSL